MCARVLCPLVGEAALVGQVVQCLLECGALEEDIGLVSPYRAQVRGSASLDLEANVISALLIA